MVLKNKLMMLFLLFFVPIYSWGDDVWFILPSDGQPVTGMMDIKVYPPPNNVPVRVWIEYDRQEQVVWLGKLTIENDYTILVDTSKFIPGKYEINAVYYLHGEDFDGDIDIWVNSR